MFRSRVPAPVAGRTPAPLTCRTAARRLHGPCRVVRARLALALGIAMALLVVSPILGATAAAQDARTPFTVDDMVNLESFSLQDLTPDGRWAAGTVSSRLDRFDTDHRRQGDPTYVSPSVARLMLLDTESGEMTAILPGKHRVRGATWSPDGRTLAFFRIELDDRVTLHLFDREEGRLRELALRTPKPLSTGSPLLWTPDGGALVVDLRAEDWHERARTAFLALTEGPVIVLDGNDDFLAWDALRNLGALSIPARVAVASGEVTALAAEEGDLSGYRIVSEGAGLLVTRRFPLRTVYGGSGGQEFEAVVLPLSGSAPAAPGVEPGEELVLRERGASRPSFTWNEEGTRYAWTTGGDVLSLALGAGADTLNHTRAFREARFEAAKAEAAERIEAGEADAKPDTTGLRFSLQRLSPDGSRMLLQSSRGWWLGEFEPAEAGDADPGQEPGAGAGGAGASTDAGGQVGASTDAGGQAGTTPPATSATDPPAADGAPGIPSPETELEFLFAFEEEEDGGPRRPQRSVTEWSPDGRHLFITTSERDRWERGLLRLEVETRQIDTLVVDAGLYSGWRLLGEEGDRLLYQWSDGDLPNEWYVADADFREARPLTQMNPWIAERTLTRSELVRYRDVDGNELFGILYYPVNYEEGKRYPLVAELYETFFNNGFNANMNMFTNAGWFGFRPSVTLEQGYPGEGWVKGVTTALNDLIERGLVDPERIGVQGGSYGGYATALLITQTNRFAAAINISGKVNMVSFYGDSPRLGVRNITAPERGQDRIGCSLWDCPQRYLAHSAIMHADRIETPLMLITGELDHNVPARQSMEMFYAMRRLEKDVVWVNYANGGHSPANTLDETHDYWERILGWYRKHFGEEEGAGGVAASTDEDGGGDR